jgi:glycerophosphoryl diester phosphodiesterase
MPKADFMVIAHRGASSYAPENTVAAFDRAVAMGIAHAELDVQFTKDGHIVVIHDDAVDRTTNGKGKVAEHTLAELKALDAGSWAFQYPNERIPTLGEVLERYKGLLHLHVEIKANAEGLSRRTADLVRGYGMTDSVTITSFHVERLEEVRAYAPELPTGWLVPLGPGRPWDDAIIAESKKLGLTQVCPRADLVTPELVNRLHREGFAVRAWGVSNEELMRRVVDAGADGMTINFPDRLVEYLKAKGM